ETFSGVSSSFLKPWAKTVKPATSSSKTKVKNLAKNIADDLARARARGQARVRRGVFLSWMYSLRSLRFSASSAVNTRETQRARRVAKVAEFSLGIHLVEGSAGLRQIWAMIAHPQNSRSDVAQTEPTRDQRLLIHNLVKRDPLAGLAEDVRKGLTAYPKRFLP